jgi:hypothetical protein
MRFLLSLFLFGLHAHTSFGLYQVSTPSSFDLTKIIYNNDNITAAAGVYPLGGA